MEGRWDFPGGPVFKTVFPHTGWEFNPWSGTNLYATQSGQKQTNKKHERSGQLDGAGSRGYEEMLVKGYKVSVTQDKLWRANVIQQSDYT